MKNDDSKPNTKITHTPLRREPHGQPSPAQRACEELAQRRAYGAASGAGVLALAGASVAALPGAVIGGAIGAGIGYLVPNWQVLGER